MNCPVCGEILHGQTRKVGSGQAVIDSRPSANNTIRRRRRCLKCGNRVTTYEIIGDERQPDPAVIRTQLAVLVGLAQLILRSLPESPAPESTPVDEPTTSCGLHAP